MTGRRLVAGLCLTALEQNNRFFSAHPPGAFEKTPPLFDAFHIQHHRLRQFIDFKPFQIILDGDHGFIAGTAKGPDADPLLFGKCQQLDPHVAGLGDDSRWTGHGTYRRARTKKIDVRIADTHGVGPQDMNAGGACRFNQLPFQRFAFGSGFPESRCNHHHLFDALGLELRNQVQHRCRRLW